MTVPELSVVIPTYRRHATLRRALAALARQTAAGRFEVLVVDDAQEDDPDAVADAVAGAGANLGVRQLHRHARGVSAARNTGWREARADLVLFLGDDILAAPDLVARHLRRHQETPAEEVGLLGHVRWADELARTVFMRWLDRGIQSDFDRLEGEEAGWGMLYTSNLSLKRAMLERVGGFDEENFPFLYEDTDLGYRLHLVGFRLLHDPLARAEHLHAPTLEEWEQRLAETARAERRWAALHPAVMPHFERLFRSAHAQPPVRGRAATALARWIGPGFPLLGRRLWARVDLHYRQRLAPHFLGAWDAEP